MGEIVLLTGGNGFLGFHILLDILRRTNYELRAVVRSQQKVVEILSHPSIRSIAPGSRLSFTIVPDITQRGAYREALIGVAFVLHVASPSLRNATPDYKASLLDPTLRGTVEILTAAGNNRTVRRVILTSSVVANRTLDTPRDQPSTPSCRVSIPQEPFDSAFAAYAAAQTTALNATDVYFEELKPRFDVFTIMPGFIIGRNQLAKSVDEIFDGGNHTALGPLIGRFNGFIPYRATAHLDDVVKVHVDALQLSGSGRHVFGVTSPMRWNDSFSVVQRHFPEAVEQGVFREAGLAGVDFPWDASETERIFNMKFKDYEEQVKSVADQYLQLLRR